MKISSKIILFLFLISVIMTPVLISAQVSSSEPFRNEGLVPDCAKAEKGKTCTLQDLFTFAQKLFKYLMWLAVTLSTISIAVAGFYYIFAGGDPGDISKAHEILKYSILGIVLAVGAWIIVNTILVGLGATGDYQQLLK
jgi:hypothetical protein